MPAYVLQDTSSPNCTLDLASTLEAGTPRSRITGGAGVNSKAVMTIAFQFAFESHLQDSVAAMARQYMRSIISSVQRIALALSSSRLVPHGGVRLLPPVTQEAETLSRWIVQSYRFVVVVATVVPECVWLVFVLVLMVLACADFTLGLSSLNPLTLTAESRCLKLFGITAAQCYAAL